MARPQRSATKTKPLGLKISAAECAELRQKIMKDPSKQISRADGARRVQEFFAAGVLEGGMLSVPFKRLSLLCPIGKKRIVDAARGVNCTHLECFDLSAYLGSQMKKPSWNCPICKKLLPAENLRVDEFTSYVVRVELDGVDSIEVYSDGSHRAVKRSESSGAKSSGANQEPFRDQAEAADTIILDDEPMAIDNGDQEATESSPLVTLPLSRLLDFERQTKDLLSRLPVKKVGKRKRKDDPADLFEEQHDALRDLIKQARATGTSLATMQSPQPVHNEAVNVTVNDELRAQNEELTSRNSALLAENLRLSRRLAELEQNHAKGRTTLRFIAATRKNTTEVLMWLDRFSLDAVQFACTLLKAIVDVYLPVAPMRILKSVIFDGTSGWAALRTAGAAIEEYLYEAGGVF
ncbi:MIZ zinc finger family protein [Aphelenchoides avenae]|nr:MIZ zinc finger family protein [Aphelenchus avenae]